jgi:hypothetical protein
MAAQPLRKKVVSVPMWVTIKAERVLRVARGRDVILCTHDIGTPPEIVVLLSPEAVAALRKQITEAG